MQDNAADQSKITLPPGFELGNFLICQVIGHGGFAFTYLAYDRELNINVVIKENFPQMFAGRDTDTGRVFPLTRENAADDYEWALKRFREEAQIIGKLHHPNIVRVIRIFKALGTAYYVMPYVGSKSLDKVEAEGGPLPEARLRPLLCSLLHALQYLHDSGLLHRDIKPANIIIDQRGEPILIDFGTASTLSQHSQSVIESPGFTPFEQIQTNGKLGPWTDIYALGCTMYKLITDRIPMRSLDRVHNDTTPRLADHYDLRTKYSQIFLQSIDKAMSMPINSRWQSATEWLTALGESPGMPLPPPTQPPSAPIPVPPAPEAGKRALKWWVRGLFATVTLSVLGAVGFGYRHQIAAYCGDTASMRELAEMYLDDNDKDKAAYWLLKAASHHDETAEEGICRLLSERDQEVLQRVKTLAKKEKMPIAQFYLGLMYGQGIGVPLDNDRALYWFTTSAENGDARGQFVLGLLYLSGTGVPEDREEAIKWFRKSAEQGYEKAVRQLEDLNIYI